MDSLLRLKTNGATPYQDAHDSARTAEVLPIGEIVLSTPLLLTGRTNQHRTICRGDSGWDRSFQCGLDEDNKQSSLLRQVDRWLKRERRFDLVARGSPRFRQKRALRRTAKVKAGLR